MTSRELLDELEARGVSGADMARALNINPSGVTRLKRGERQLMLDEAVKLVERFGLEDGEQRQPLPPAIKQLVARYIVRSLGLAVSPDDPKMIDLVEDLSAFVRFVDDPQARDSIQGAESFFRAMELRRPAGQKEDRQQNPAPNHN